MPSDSSTSSDTGPDLQGQLGPLEVEVLRALSGLEPPVSVRRVCDALPRDGYFAYQGVLNCLNRLAGKGVLRREKQGHVYVYSPAVEIEHLAARLVNQMIGTSPEQIDRVICRLLEVDPTRAGEHIAELRKRVRRMKGRNQG
jgi:predicted transcriptional regulator